MIVNGTSDGREDELGPRRWGFIRAAVQLLLLQRPTGRMDYRAAIQWWSGLIGMCSIGCLVKTVNGEQLMFYRYQ